MPAATSRARPTAGKVVRACARAVRSSSSTATQPPMPHSGCRAIAHGSACCSAGVSAGGRPVASCSRRARRTSAPLHAQRRCKTEGVRSGSSARPGHGNLPSPGPRGIGAVRRPTQADRRQQILTLRDSWRDRGARAGAESRYCLAPGYRTYLLCGCCSYWPAVPAAVSPYVRAHMTAAGQTISLLTIGSNDPPPNQ